MAADDPTKERFEILRKRAQQAARTQTQQEKEGLQRRFAQIGQVGSGAQIRSEAQAAERGAKRLQRAEETVGLAELAERQRRAEIAEGREFQRGEREAGQRFAGEQAGLGREFSAEQAGLGRQFAAQQAGLQRQFATGEREAGQRFAGEQTGIGRVFQQEQREAAQKFAGEQAGIGRVFQQEQRRESQEFGRGERLGAQEFAASQAEMTRALQENAAAFREKAFDESVRQFELQFSEDKATTEFNKEMAEDSASRTLWDDLGLGDLFRTPAGPILL
jgi:hypothetical protein